MLEDARRLRGTEKIKEILGQTPDDVQRSIGDLSPRLADYVLIQFMVRSTRALFCN